jgi:hypothetical protein
LNTRFQKNIDSQPAEMNSSYFEQLSNLTPVLTECLDTKKKSFDKLFDSSKRIILNSAAINYITAASKLTVKNEIFVKCKSVDQATLLLLEMAGERQTYIS